MRYFRNGDATSSHRLHCRRYRYRETATIPSFDDPAHLRDMWQFEPRTRDYTVKRIISWVSPSSTSTLHPRYNMVIVCRATVCDNSGSKVSCSNLRSLWLQESPLENLLPSCSFNNVFTVEMLDADLAWQNEFCNVPVSFQSWGKKNKQFQHCM